MDTSCLNCQVNKLVCTKIPTELKCQNCKLQGATCEYVFKHPQRKRDRKTEGEGRSSWSREGVNLTGLSQRHYASSADLLRDLKQQTKKRDDRKNSNQKNVSTLHSRNVTDRVSTSFTLRKRHCSNPDAIIDILLETFNLRNLSIENHLANMQRARAIGGHLLSMAYFSHVLPDLDSILGRLPQSWDEYEKLCQQEKKSKSEHGSRLEILITYAIAKSALHSPHSEILGRLSQDSLPYDKEDQEGEIHDFRAQGKARTSAVMALQQKCSQIALAVESPLRTPSEASIATLLNILFVFWQDNPILASEALKLVVSHFEALWKSGDENVRSRLLEKFFEGIVIIDNEVHSQFGGSPDWTDARYEKYRKHRPGPDHRFYIYPETLGIVNPIPKDASEAFAYSWSFLESFVRHTNIKRLSLICSTQEETEETLENMNRFLNDFINWRSSNCQLRFRHETSSPDKQSPKNNFFLYSSGVSQTSEPWWNTNLIIGRLVKCTFVYKSILTTSLNMFPHSKRLWNLEESYVSLKSIVISEMVKWFAFVRLSAKVGKFPVSLWRGSCESILHQFDFVPGGFRNFVSLSKETPVLSQHFSAIIAHAKYFSWSSRRLSVQLDALDDELEKSPLPLSTSNNNVLTDLDLSKNPFSSPSTTIPVVHNDLKLDQHISNPSSSSWSLDSPFQIPPSPTLEDFLQTLIGSENGNLQIDMTTSIPNISV